MFNVVNKKDPNNIVTVYSIRTKDIPTSWQGFVEFLIFDNGGWLWVTADRYIPVPMNNPEYPL